MVVNFLILKHIVGTLQAKSGLRTELLDMSIQLLATSIAQRPWHTSHTMTHERIRCNRNAITAIIALNKSPPIFRTRVHSPHSCSSEDCECEEWVNSRSKSNNAHAPHNLKVIWCYLTPFPQCTRFCTVQFLGHKCASPIPKDTF